MNVEIQVKLLSLMRKAKRLLMPDQPPSGTQFPVVMLSSLAPEFFTGASRHDGSKSATAAAFRDSTKQASKWSHYFDIYDECLVPLRDWLTATNQTPGILEIGTARGGSLVAWRQFFGPQAVICGVDISPKETRFDDPNITLVTGSQTDEDVLRHAVASVPKIHVIIDDGSHIGKHQKISFRYLWKHLANGGVYIVEDLHTSYWREFERGILRRRKTGFIEYAKQLVDVQHAHYTSRHLNKQDVANLRDSMFSITFFDSVVAIRKADLPATRLRVSNLPEDDAPSH